MTMRASIQQAHGSSEFVRERQMVELSDGRRLECWFYRYNGKADKERIIASGAWRRNSSR